MDDLMLRLLDLHKQAVHDRSHFYTGSLLTEAMIEIRRLRLKEMIMKQTLGEIAEGDECGNLACVPEDPRCDYRRVTTALKRVADTEDPTTAMSE